MNRLTRFTNFKGHQRSMSRLGMRRWYALLALVALLSQALLPTLRLATLPAGELRAEAILTTALCSKPNLSVADRVDALLNPWKQHDSKQHHCDACPKNVDAPVALVVTVPKLAVFSDARAVVHAIPSARFTFARALVPPSRAPPVFS
jgi:hypothetical protein